MGIILAEETGPARFGEHCLGRQANEGRMGAGMRQHEPLRDEVEIGQPSPDELEVPGIAVTLLLSDEFAHGAHLGEDVGTIALGSDDPCNGLLNLLAEGLIARHDPGPRERHVLPQIRFAPLVGDETPELGCDGSLASLGTKAQVDLVEAPAPGRHGQRRHEALGEPGEIDHGIKRTRPGTLPALLVEIVDHHKVEIGACRQLAGAETPEAEDGDPAAWNSSVLGLEDLPDLLEGRPDDRAGDGRVGLAHLGGRDDAGEEPCAGNEPHLPRRIAGAIQKFLMAARLPDELPDLLLDGGILRQGLAEGRIDEGVEHMGSLRDHICQARRGAEQIGEEKAQTIMGLHDGQKLHRGGHPAEGAVQGG
jgi:hypothetical protein